MRRGHENAFADSSSQNIILWTIVC